MIKDSPLEPAVGGRNPQYFIAIPSYKRSMVLLHRTLNFLERNSIDPKLIYIFIVEEDKEDYYRVLERYATISIVVGVKGLAKHF